MQTLFHFKEQIAQSGTASRFDRIAKHEPMGEHLSPHVYAAHHTKRRCHVHRGSDRACVLIEQRLGGAIKSKVAFRFVMRNPWPVPSPYLVRSQRGRLRRG